MVVFVGLSFPCLAILIVAHLEETDDARAGAVRGGVRLVRLGVVLGEHLHISIIL